MATIRKWRDKWQVQIRRKGCPALSKSFINRKDAQAWARLMEVQADRKDLPQDPKQLERLTLGQLVVRYRDTVTPRKRGQDVEAIVLNAFLRHTICSRRLSNLSANDFASYRDERLKSVTANTLRREFSPLHNLFEVARDEWGLPIRENPLDKVRLECPNNRRERRLRLGELDAIVQAAKATKNRLVLPIIRFALETGLRRSELLSCTWESVDFGNRCLTLLAAKNGRPRIIPLTRNAVAILQSLQKGGDKGPLFRVSTNALKLAWVRLVRRAKIVDLHFHDLRHEAISRFFELGLTAPEVALISGHSDMRMLFRYTHATRSRILERLDA
jgi:integrase